MGFLKTIFSKKNGSEKKMSSYWRDTYEEETENVAMLTELENKIHNGDLKACVELARYYKSEGDAQKTFIYLKQAIEGKEYSAYSTLGHIYAEGILIEEDTDKAIQCYRMAADHGDKDGMYWLGINYLDGDLVAKDELMGCKYLLAAAKLGETAAQARLGKCYYHGIGVAQNDEEAFKWLYRSVHDTEYYFWGGYYLGLCYLYGKGTLRDEKRAVEVLEKALQENAIEKDAIRDILAECYHNGIGVRKNINQARQYKADAQRSRDLFDRLAAVLDEDELSE